MKFTVRVVVCLLCCIPATHAQEIKRAKMPAKIGHYIRTQKELLISDAILVLAESADAGSTVHCQHVSRGCIETNSIIGPHPSNAATWADAEVTAVGLIVLLHCFWWQANKVDPEARHLVLLFPIVDGIATYWSVTGNVEAANQLENARSRVMRK
jgi:hypothetical protein